MTVRDVHVIDASIAHRLHMGHRIWPPLRSEAGPVPPRVRDDAQPVGLDQETGVPDERDPHLSGPLQSVRTTSSIIVKISRLPMHREAEPRAGLAELEAAPPLKDFPSSILAAAVLYTSIIPPTSREAIRAGSDWPYESATSSPGRARGTSPDTRRSSRPLPVARGLSLAR